MTAEYFFVTLATLAVLGHADLEQGPCDVSARAVVHAFDDQVVRVGEPVEFADVRRDRVRPHPPEQAGDGLAGMCSTSPSRMSSRTWVWS
jgi:hypothetical protein